MRNTYTYNVNNISIFKNILLEESKMVDYISILDSNSNFSKLNLPECYIKYDLIAGVDALHVLDSNCDSFNHLQNFHDKYQDWMFGYLSYDLKNNLEKLTSKNSDGIKASLLSFFVPRYVLILNGNSLQIKTYEDRQNCTKFLSDKFIVSDKSKGSLDIKQRDSKDVYIKKIEEIKTHIQRGDIYEMNYCQEFFADNAVINPSLVFNHLNKISNSPFASFLKLNHIYLMCSSPERFIKKIDNKIISQPIKGTRKRGCNAIEDAKLFQELKTSAKDISENIMITDLVRNDLSITAVKDSVNVTELCEVYTFERIHQMITTITSDVSDDTNFSQILKSVFPMGSMTGAPKLKAMKLIEEFESFKRGIFSGANGYITPDGNFDFNVILRAILYNEKRKYLTVGVGGAITIKSDPLEEYEECIVKVKPIFEVLDFKIDEE